MTNFEKIKQELAKLTPEEFADKIYNEWWERDDPWCGECLREYTCEKCFVKWLKEEVEE